MFLSFMPIPKKNQPNKPRFKESLTTVLQQ